MQGDMRMKKMAYEVSFEVDYEFDQIEVTCPGLLAEGTATLVHDSDNEFYVSEFTLKGGNRFDRHGTGALGSDFSKRLFNTIAVEIEADKYAQEFFSRELEEYRSSLAVAAE
jgi:hypothetical protein